MNIFEQLEAAEYVLVSGDTISTSFTWDDDPVTDDELEIPYLTVFIYDSEGEHQLEFLLSEMMNAEKIGTSLTSSGWIVGTTKLEFCKIACIEEPRSSRRDRFVDRCIEMRQAQNVVARAILTETNPITIELVKLEVRHMQNCINDMELEIQEMDFPGGLTQVT